MAPESPLTPERLRALRDAFRVSQRDFAALFDPPRSRTWLRQFEDGLLPVTPWFERQVARAIEKLRARQDQAAAGLPPAGTPGTGS